jgi:hypothetical protein
MARHGVTAIEVGQHQGRRIGVRHDHLGNQRREDRQRRRVRQSPADCEGRNGQNVERQAQPLQPERRRIDHRPGTEQAPVQARAAQSLEVGQVRPVRGLHRGHIDAAAPGRVDVEERVARHEPVTRPVFRTSRR